LFSFFFKNFLEKERTFCFFKLFCVFFVARLFLQRASDTFQEARKSKKSEKQRIFFKNPIDGSGVFPSE
jgi:hypothetical protein